MLTIKSALLWALAILSVAIASNLGLISESVSQTLIFILPVLAITSVRGVPCLGGTKGMQS